MFVWSFFQVTLHGIANITHQKPKQKKHTKNECHINLRANVSCINSHIWIIYIPFADMYMFIYTKFLSNRYHYL